MIIHYKVLGAMVTLREFDVHELAELSGVKPVTVRTVIGRERSLLERIDQANRGQHTGRGGRYFRYRVKPEVLQSLKNKVSDLFNQIPQSEVHQTLVREPQIPIRV